MKLIFGRYRLDDAARALHELMLAAMGELSLKKIQTDTCLQIMQRVLLLCCVYDLVLLRT